MLGVLQRQNYGINSEFRRRALCAKMKQLWRVEGMLRHENAPTLTAFYRTTENERCREGKQQETPFVGLSLLIMRQEREMNTQL
jgi:hypothetical protein